MIQEHLFQINIDENSPLLWNKGEEQNEPSFGFQIDANVEELLNKANVRINDETINKAQKIIEEVERDVFCQMARGEPTYHPIDETCVTKQGIYIPTQYALSMAWMFEEAGIEVQRGIPDKNWIFTVPREVAPIRGVDGGSPPKNLEEILQILEEKTVRRLKTLQFTANRFTDDDFLPRSGWSL